ncbi:MAG: helix-turn-helix domain-containing protein [Rikenellaceae bacterium]
MKIINIEERAYEKMMARFNDFTQAVERICQTNSNKQLDEWLDNQDVCTMLNIKPRTLQSYRDSGAIGFTKIGNKIYYRAADVLNLLNAA